MRFDLKDIHAWPWSLKALVLGVVFLVSFILTYVSYVHSQYRVFDAIVKEVNILKQGVFEKEKKVKLLSEHQASLALMHQTFDMGVSWPEVLEVPKLLEALNDVGLRAGLVFRSIRLEAENKKEGYTETPIEIVVSGDYHQFGQFVSDVALMPFWISMHDFSIRPIDLSNAEQGLMMILTVKTYHGFTEKSEVPFDMPLDLRPVKPVSYDAFASGSPFQSSGKEVKTFEPLSERWVGTLEKGDVVWALIKDEQGKIHRFNVQS